MKHSEDKPTLPTELEPMLRVAGPPRYLSIEPINRPVFVHPYHLGHDYGATRLAAKELFKIYHEDQANPLCPNGIYTVAVMTRAISGVLSTVDIYDGASWMSATGDKSPADEEAFADSFRRHEKHGALYGV